MRRRWMLAGAGLLVALLTGCASASEPDVAKVATAFEDPSGDAQSRCDLLPPPPPAPPAARPPPPARPAGHVRVRLLRLVRRRPRRRPAAGRRGQLGRDLGWRRPGPDGE